MTYSGMVTKSFMDIMSHDALGTQQNRRVLIILGRELRLRGSEYYPTALSRAGFGLGHSGSTVLLLWLCRLRIRAQATGRTGAKCQGSGLELRAHIQEWGAC